MLSPALELVLDFATTRRLTDTPDSIAAIFEDKQLPLRIRIRAAVALAVLQDFRGGELLTATALSSQDFESQRYAIRHLHSVVGDEAVKTLCDVIRNHGHQQGWVVDAMRNVPSIVAVPELIQLLKERKDGNCIDCAIACLGDKGEASRAALPLLIALLKTEPNTKDPLWTQQLVAIALGEMGRHAKSALPDLIRLAKLHAPEEWKSVNDPTSSSWESDDPFGHVSAFVEAASKIQNAGNE